MDGISKSSFEVSDLQQFVEGAEMHQSGAQASALTSEPTTEAPVALQVKQRSNPDKRSGKKDAIQSTQLPTSPSSSKGAKKPNASHPKATSRDDRPSASPSPNLPILPQKKPTQRGQGSLFRKVQNNDSRNIVIFGETGIGKSSLINMLAGDSVAIIGNRAVGCTFESRSYPVTIDGAQYTFWDTAGLNEGDAGTVPATTALSHLRDLVERLRGGLSLLVYCIRGARYRDILKVNYDIFTEIICQGEIPVVIVVTGLEHEERMDDWWTANESEFTSRGMKFQGHACVTTIKGRKDMFEEEYSESKKVLRDLIKNTCPGDAWVVDSNAWFQRITSRIQGYYDEYNGYSRPRNGVDGGNRGLEEQRDQQISCVFPWIAGFFAFLGNRMSQFL